MLAKEKNCMDWLSRLFEHDRNLAVICGQPCADVAHEDDDVCRINGDLRLQSHLREDDIVGLGLNSARVDEDHFAASPFGFAVNTVAGDTGGVLDDRTALADQFIKQSTFTNVGASHDGDNRFCHNSVLSLLRDAKNCTNELGSVTCGRTCGDAAESFRELGGGHVVEEDILVCLEHDGGEE